MRPSQISLIALSVAAGLTLTLSRDGAPRATSHEDLLALLDPAALGQSLCGKQGKERGLFFRPEFRLTLTQAAAEAAPAPAETPSMQTYDDTPPLWDNLGPVTFPITTKNPEAQKYFDQGLKLAYGFNHWEAARAFRQAQALDPACAICYWGEALVLGPNINLAMAEDATEPAFAAAAKAQVLAAGATPMEQALIAALAKRYSPDPKADRAVLDKAYAEEMAKVYRRYADNDDIAVLYVEALMDLHPWDYYERDMMTLKPDVADVIPVVEAVLKRNPNHPEAIHLYIHLTEPTSTAGRAAPYADKLAGLTPGLGHLVHMPGHTYFRIGRYLDSLHTNLKAVQVDEAYLAKVQGSDMYRHGYYPHNVHFVLVSAQMAGDGALTLEYARKLDALLPIEALSGVPIAHPVKAAYYYALAQFGSPEEMMATPKPPAGFPYVEAMWHYMQGVAAVETGNMQAASGHIAAMRVLADDPKAVELTTFNIPAPDVFRLAALIVEGRLAVASGDLESGIALYKKAAEAQSALSYTEPPYWYYPVEQTLGAALLQAGRNMEAADAFKKALIRHPNNAWSLYGLMKAEEAMGDPAAPLTAELYAKATDVKDPPPLERF